MTRMFVPDTDLMNSQVITPDEVKAEDAFGYKIIAKVWKVPFGTGRCWCAYQASTAWSDDHVIRSGDEILEEAARLLFPTIAKLGIPYYNP